MPRKWTLIFVAGHYAYILSSAQSKDDVAYLISPGFQSVDEDCVVTMWAFMHGTSVGTLRLFLESVHTRLLGGRKR